MRRRKEKVQQQLRSFMEIIRCSLGYIYLPTTKKVSCINKKFSILLSFFVTKEFKNYVEFKKINKQ